MLIVVIRRPDSSFGTVQPWKGVFDMFGEIIITINSNCSVVVNKYLS